MAVREGVLVLIGSGETGPRMARVQREVVAALRGTRDGRARATVIDTPYGFQSNADAVSDGLVDFLERRLRLAARVASLRRSDVDPLEQEQAYARIATADLVFSGPGSPSYALRHWSTTRVPELLLDALRRGAAVVLASAAAITSGRFTLPVYEIYKAGEDARWLPGLDLTTALGIGPAAVVSHWDNHEGAGHDTRYCFVGQRRLLELEAQLPPEAFILGIDEHTALVLDLAQGMASVRGVGGVTIRRQGNERRLEAGAVVELVSLSGTGALARKPQAMAESPGREEPDDATEVDVLVRRVLAVAPAEQRSGIVHLGELAARALAQDDRLVPALIAALVEVRDAARSRGDYATADLIRDRLGAMDIQLVDGADRTRYRVVG